MKISPPFDDRLKPLLPVFLKLERRAVLVAGAGRVAARKIADLIAAGAAVRVVAPDAAEPVRAAASQGELAWESRAFQEADVEGAWLVVAATDDAPTQARIAAACEARQVFCIAIDDPPNASAYSGATLRRGPFTIAISSSGEAPALSRLVREILEAALPEDRWIDAAKELRARWKRDKTPMGERFRDLLATLSKRES
jgi:siroheme synthase-like protein